MRCWLVVVFLCLPLAGCGAGPVSPADVAKIIAALSAAAALAGRKTDAGISFGQFLRQRVAYLLSKNPAWATEANYVKLTTRIGAEMDQLSAVIVARRIALGGTDPLMPNHCDLQDATKRLVSDGASTIATNFTKNKQDRIDRIAQIVWRAGALHPELWAGGDATLAPVLQQMPLLEVLDRRLRTIELMMLHDEGDLGKWSVASATAGWKDEQRTSMFQYPWVGTAGASPNFVDALAANGLTPASLAPTFREEPAEHRIYYAPKMNRPRPPSTNDWTVSDAPYVITYASAGPPSAALERLVPSAATTPADFEDFWQRNWFYCDMMIAALHVDAIRFARKRRKGNDADFDNSANAGITLRPLIPRTGMPSPGALMSDGATWFEGVSIPHDQLQVGDHLVYWNNPFVRHLLKSAFGLENSLVMRIDTDGNTVTLAGHGEPEMNERAFADELASEIKSAHDGLRKAINQKFTANPNVALIGLKRMGVSFQLVRWAPFNENFKPAAARRLAGRRRMVDPHAPRPTARRRRSCPDPGRGARAGAALVRRRHRHADAPAARLRRSRQRLSRVDLSSALRTERRQRRLEELFREPQGRPDRHPR
jgi:hypothetical protein